MKHCNATYKTSVRFENFYKQGRYFYYPFGPCDSKANVSDWFILKEFHPEIFTPERASLYFNTQYILNEENKLTDEDNYIEDNAAYHFDSPLLGKFLKKYCKKRGVEIVEDSFYGITPNDDGSVKFLVGDKDIYSADLFIDCSGFKSLLLGQMMKEEYIPFSDTLINNKALAAKIPYTNKEKQLKNYTNSVALDNGWCWEIPLWDGLSVGYVHTNMFASEEEIENEVKKVIDETGAEGMKDMGKVMGIVTKKLMGNTFSLKLSNLLNERYEKPATYSQDGRQIRFGFIKNF